MTELIRLDANAHVTCTVTFPARVKRKHQHGIRKEKEIYIERRKGFLKDRRWNKEKTKEIVEETGY